MRKRTTSASSCGSKWMSEAPSSAAWKRTELTRRTSGASEMPSSASRSVVLVLSRLRSRRGRPRPRRARRTPRTRGRACWISIEDVLARGDAELDRVAGREPELVDPVQVRRIGDRDAQTSVLERRTGSRRRARARGAGSSARRPRRRRVDARSTSGKLVPRREHRGRCPRSTRRPRRRAPRRASRSAGRGRAPARACRRGTSFVAESRSTTSSTDSFDAESAGRERRRAAGGLGPVVRSDGVSGSCSFTAWEGGEPSRSIPRTSYRQRQVKGLDRTIRWTAGALATWRRSGPPSLGLATELARSGRRCAPSPENAEACVLARTP